MSSIEYYKPAGVQEALRVLVEKGPRAVVMAGGTDIMVALNEGTLDKDCLVILPGMDQLGQMSETAEGLSLGPLVTMAELARSPLVMEKAGCLSEAALKAASPQVRNLGTIGGNLGTGSPAGDLLPPLMVLNARVSISSLKGEYELTLDKLLVGPKETALSYEELITAVYLPVLPPGSGSSFVKLGKRKALTISIASAAAVVTVSADGKRFTDVRVALGSLAPTVVRARKVEEALVGQPVEEKVIEKASALVKEHVSPITDGRATAWYRAEVAGPLVKKSLVAALARVSKT